MNTKKLSFRGGVADEYGNVTEMSAGGHTLALSLGVNGLGGTFDGKYTIDGARNVFSSRDPETKQIAADALKTWQGAVNLVGDGYTLSLAIAAKGKVKVTGTVNGVKVTATSQLLIGEENCCIPVVITKKANLAANVWLTDKGEIVVSGLEGAVAGKAGSIKAGVKVRFGDEAAKGLSALAGVMTKYLPDGLAVSQNGTKWVVAGGAKAGKVAFVRGTTEVDEAKAGANPSALKLTYKAKDGSIKGSFKAYAVVNGRIKAYSFTVTGVMVGNVGYCTATLKKSAVSFPITIE